LIARIFFVLFGIECYLFFVGYRLLVIVVIVRD